MNKRGGVVAILLVAIGFGLGWLTRGAIGPTAPATDRRDSAARQPTSQRAEQSSVQVLVSVGAVPVLRYEGPTLDAALAGTNKQPPSKVLTESVAIDGKNPLFGTLTARIDIHETHRSGAVSSSPHYSREPVQIVLARKDRDAIDWALTPEAIAAISRVRNQG
jgi:hypothetical protein